MTVDTCDGALICMSIRLRLGNNQDHQRPRSGRTAILGDTMTMLLMATVGFLGMAAAMLHSGHDLDFDNRQISGAYRSRWA
ncbi:hypothetical protein [Rhodococcus sovatensis]|uniref:Uncharacterized protein n=1 Tax=Rhodococcus sovatensis TaxID=1805840 RepID=A0ABZ2PM58_9NOCA